MARRRRRKRKAEWSKKFAGITAGGFGLLAVWATFRHYELAELAIINQSTAAPDPSLAIAFVKTVIAALLSYLLYQAGLKNSRNKYGIDEDGRPFNENPPDDGAVG